MTYNCLGEEGCSRENFNQSESGKVVGAGIQGIFNTTGCDTLRILKNP
jgi:hypothetical protein